ncbi:MAG: SURF1 family protein, partial [Anaerolineales bacterium]
MGKSSLAIRVLLISGIAVGALAMVGLGFWQLARLAERRTFNAEVRARLAQPPLLLTGQPLTGAAQLEYRPVIARGEYDFANEIVLRNRAHAGQPGVHVLTPLKLTGSDVAVLVNRGWIP